MSRTLLLFLGFCLALVAAGEQARYDNYRVYAVKANNVGSLGALKNIEGSSDSLIFLDGIHSTGKDIHVVVAPHKLPDFLQYLELKGIEYKLVEKNAQSKLNSLETTIGTRSGAYDWTAYHELNDTYNWLRSLAKQYPQQVTVISAGKTYEGRDILGIKISYKANNSGVFVEGGIHAREWISPATVTYIINELLTSKNSAIRNAAETLDWYFFPHTNPDGYVYTHTTNRMWRKTRSPQGSCFGADANRNWDFHWNEVGASSNPCSDTFAGPKAFSEIETKSLSDYIKTLKGKIQLYLSFHSYSQFLLYPYGHSKELPPNNADLKRIFNVAVAAVARRYGTKYTGGNIYDAIYPAAGASLDWAYGTQGVKLSYCYELRPSSSSIWTGFQLPASQIISTGQETLDSVVAMVNEAKTLKYLK